jgi:hypothetical protein
MPSQRPLPAPGHEPGASGFAGFLLALEGPDDQDLLLAGGPMRDVVLRWRGGRVAALEAGFDPVARLIGAGVAPDTLAEALAGRPGGIHGLALLAWLVDAGAGHEGLVRAAATALAVEAAAELLTLPPERLEARPAPDAPATVPPAADLAIAPAALIEAATNRHEELARLAAVVPGPGAVARLTGGPGPSDAAVLARIDGRRTVTDLAAASGLTRFEVATALAALAGAGVIEIDAGAASWPTPWVAPPAPEPVADARAELAAFQAEQPAEPGQEPDQTPEPDQAPEPAPEPTPEPVEEPVPADVGAAWLALREVSDLDDQAAGRLHGRMLPALSRTGASRVHRDTPAS